MNGPRSQTIPALVVPLCSKIFSMAVSLPLQNPGKLPSGLTATCDMDRAPKECNVGLIARWLQQS